SAERARGRSRATGSRRSSRGPGRPASCKPRRGGAESLRSPPHATRDVSPYFWISTYVEALAEQFPLAARSALTSTVNRTVFGAPGSIVNVRSCAVYPVSVNVQIWKSFSALL